MVIDDASFDVVESGGEPDRRRRTALVVLLVLAIVAAGAGWYADRISRLREVTAVIGCAQEAQVQWTESTQRVSAMAEYVRPSLAFAAERTVDGLTMMIAHEAATAGGGLQQARDGCADVRVLPWHSAQQKARDAQLALIDARLDLVAATAQDGRAWFSDQNRLVALDQAAMAAVDAAKPGLPGE